MKITIYQRCVRLHVLQLEDRETPSVDPFTIVAMPDTQHYNQYAALNGIIHAQTQWIVDHRVDQSIAMVMGLGDIVQHGSTLVEWQVADAAFDRLDGNLQQNPNGLLPYTTPPGNHDYNTINVQSSGSTLYSQFFGSSRFQGRSWYGGSYLERNSFAKFTAGGYQFLQIALEFEPTDDVIDWARWVIRNNPGLPTILTTHSYLFDTSAARLVIHGSDEGASGETLFRKLVYPNSQIFMVLNGHFNNTALPGGGGEFQQVSYNARGLPVFEMLSDYQERENQDTGLMRLIRFDMMANQIQVKTYSPSQNLYETDADSQFVYNVNFAERFAAGAPDPVMLSAFQEGVDLGLGTYTGTQDTQLRQSAPSTSYGSDPADLLVDFPDANNASQALVRFDNIFGTGLGQVPLGSRILSATLTVDSNNAGVGGRFYRMAGAWTEASTWTSLGGGVQANGLEAHTTYESQVGIAALTPLVPPLDQVTINVAADIRAWSAGETNRGWAVLPWTGGTDGWAFAPSESAIAALRPKLRIEWLPVATDSNVATTVIQQGLNGYAGAADTYLAQIAPSINYSTDPKLYVDKANADNAQTSLLRFDQLFGTGANQVRIDSRIDAAYLYLTTPYSDVNAPGGGAIMHRVAIPWTADSTWESSFDGDGVQADNSEALSITEWNTGSVGTGVIRVDVTASLKAWQAGGANDGWTLLANSTDGWQVASSDAEAIGDRPRLVVISQKTPPRVESVIINNGGVQRSRLTTLSVTFSTEMFGPDGGPPTASAFELKRFDGLLAFPVLTVQTVNNRTVATLDGFTGPGTEFGSLADGRWTLRVQGNLMNSDALRLDGNGDGIQGDDYLLIGNTTTNKFFRFFGDSDGDGDVDVADFIAFRSAFGAGSTVFDSDGDGDTDATDFVAFRARFGTILP